MALTKTELNKRWRTNSRAKYLISAKKRRKTPRARFGKYKHNAIKRGYEFLLTFEEFQEIISQNCHYCGSESFVGIDRKDNNLGYVIENCLPCCKDCNMLKRTMDYESFVGLCLRIAKNTGLGMRV